MNQQPKMNRAARRQVRRVLKGVIAAAGELMTEFVSKQRACNWGVANEGMYNAERMAADLKEQR